MKVSKKSVVSVVLVIVVVIVLFILGNSSLYTVKVNEAAIIVRLGKIQSI